MALTFIVILSTNLLDLVNFHLILTNTNGTIL